MKFPGFIGGSYQSAAVTADNERTVNWYPEILESPGAPVEAALYPTPGVTALATQYDGAGRGHLYADSREFVVIGDWVYEADSAGALTSVGQFGSGGGSVAYQDDRDTTPVTIDTSGDGGNELFFAASGFGYYYDLAAGGIVTPIAALDHKANMGGFMDGYFLCLDQTTSTLYISNLYDATTWTTGTDFAQRSLAGDPWKAMKVAGRYVWLFGEQTTEIWQDTGETFPFSPIPSALLNYGIAAPWSVAVVDNDVVWLARNESGRLCVIRAGGVNPQIISTQPLETLIAGYSDFSTAVADSYSADGHSFYLLNFDTTGITHVWDATTGLWHERGTWNTATATYSSWRPRFHQYAFGQHRMLDCLAGYTPAQIGGGTIGSPLYQVATSLTSDVDGGVIRRMRRAPALMNENRRVTYPGFELDLEPGLGTSGQGENPQVMMRFSDDGKTWSSEHFRSAGKTGEFSKRVRWDRLGAGRRRVFEVSVTDPIPWKITGAYLTPDPTTEGGAGRLIARRQRG